MYLPLISIVMEHKQHLTEDAYNLPSSHPRSVIMNGDATGSHLDVRPNTPQTAHKSVTFDTKQTGVLAQIAGGTGLCG